MAAGQTVELVAREVGKAAVGEVVVAMAAAMAGEAREGAAT